MSKEKQCECCHEWWYDSDVKENLCPNCCDYFKQLKQQIEEKDKEIERLKQELEETNAGYDFTYEQSTETIKELKQNQTQLAIHELEKTKDLLLNESKNNPIIYDVNDDLVGGAIDKDAVFKIIDQQIKELKGE